MIGILPLKYGALGTEYGALATPLIANTVPSEALERLKKNDVPCARCHTLDEALSQEQLQASDSVQIQDHPLMGKLRAVRTPARFNGEALSIGAPAPAHGQQTNSILESFGVDDRKIAQMREDGVIA